MRLIVWNVTKRKDRYLLNIIYIYFIQTTLYLYTTYYVKYHFTKTLSCIHGHNTRRWCCCSASTPLGETCLRMDLTAIHKNLENLAYKDDEGVTTEVLLFWFDLFFSKSTFMALMSHDFLKLVCSCHSICGQIRCRTHWTPRRKGMWLFAIKNSKLQ